MLTTSDKALAARLRAVRHHGLDPDTAEADFILPRLNCRLTDSQGALGVTQMAKLERIIAARRSCADNYTRLLANTGVQAPVVPPGSHHVFQSYVIMLPAGQAARRRGIIDTLKQNGVETTIGTWHMPLTSYFRSKYGYAPGDFPVADQVFARALTLPLHERLTPAEQQTVITHLNNMLSSGGA